MFNEKFIKPSDDQMIIAKNVYFDTDTHKTLRNNNVAIVGASGSGKTSSIIAPNILQANSNYIVTDPKGKLYQKYKKYLERKGYDVCLLDFIDTYKSTVKYNIFKYIRTEQDMIRMARDLCVLNGAIMSTDRFWEDSATILMTAIIALIIESAPSDEHNLGTIFECLQAASISEPDCGNKSALDLTFEKHMKDYPNNFSSRQYQKFIVNPDKTRNCIVGSALSTFGAFDTQPIRKLTSDDTLKLDDFYNKKKAIFVNISDTDRSMDPLINMFFGCTMNYLCKFADEGTVNGFEYPIQIIMDDFATNVVINDFDRMISSIRSRNISVMIALQSNAQLESFYGDKGQTILGNCDTYVYLGGNDLCTANEVSIRSGAPFEAVLSLPVGNAWIFRRGERPQKAEIFPGRNFEKEKLYNKRKGNKQRILSFENHSKNIHKYNYIPIGEK